MATRRRRRAIPTTIPGGPSGRTYRRHAVTIPETFDTVPQTIVHGAFDTPMRYDETRTRRMVSRRSGNRHVGNQAAYDGSISAIETVAIGAGAALMVYLLAKMVSP